MDFATGNIGGTSSDGYDICLNCYLKATNELISKGETPLLYSMQLQDIKKLVKSPNIGAEVNSSNDWSEYRKVLDTKRKRETRVYRRLINAVLVVFIIVLSSKIFDYINNDETKSDVVNSEQVYQVDTPDVKTAYYMSQEFVKHQLKAPATAKFPSFAEIQAERIDDSTFSILGFVDAQNSFGALLRNEYFAIIICRGKNNWIGKSVQLF